MNTIYGCDIGSFCYRISKVIAPHMLQYDMAT